MTEELNQLKAKAQVMHDLHDALGVEWGSDPYAVIKRLKADSSMFRLCQKALDEIGEIVAPGVTFHSLSALIAMVKERVGERSREECDPVGANTHDESENCWCSPTVEVFENGNRLIIHNDPN